jgi:hypothetical protein
MDHLQACVGVLMRGSSTSHFRRNAPCEPVPCESKECKQIHST